MSGRTAWGVVVASFLAMVVGNGPINTFAFGVFLRPVILELGLTRGTFSNAMGVGLLMTAVAMPFFGAAVDRHGVRRCLLFAVPLYVAGIALLSLLPPSALGVYLMFALAGLLAAGQTPNAYSKAVSVWFDRKRGLALGIATSGVGFGTVLMPQLSAYLIGEVGWRSAFLCLAVTIVVVAYLPILFLMREPVAGSQGAMATAASLPGLTREEAVRTGRFRAIAAAFFIAGIVIVGTMSQLVPMMSDRGLTPAETASVMSVAGMALIVGRLAAGYALDRIFAPYVTVFFFILPLAGISLLVWGGSTTMALTGAILLGAAIGADFDIVPFLMSRYFGLRTFGQLYGIVLSIFLVGSGLGPVLLGTTFDLTGSYRLMLVLFLPLLVIGSVLLLRLGPYPFPARGADAAASPASVPASV